MDQFTIKDRPHPTGVSAEDFGRAAAAFVEALNNPDYLDLASDPKAGIIYAPAGATESDRTKAAIGFAQRLIPTGTLDLSTQNSWGYEMGTRTLLPVLGDPGLAAKTAAAQKGDRQAYSETFDRLRDSGLDTMKQLAALDGDASSLSVKELAFGVLSMDANKDGVLSNDEARVLMPKGAPSVEVGSTAGVETSYGLDEVA